MQECAPHTLIVVIKSFRTVQSANAPQSQHSTRNQCMKWYQLIAKQRNIYTDTYIYIEKEARNERTEEKKTGWHNRKRTWTKTKLDVCAHISIDAFIIWFLSGRQTCAQLKYCANRAQNCIFTSVRTVVLNRPYEHWNSRTEHIFFSFFTVYNTFNYVK